MTTYYVGGLRSRLIWDAVYNMIHDSLDSLGWFDPNRDHAPIFMIPEPYTSIEEIQPNTLTLVPEDMDSIDMELGSRLTERSRTFWMDFFAEDEVIATHMIGDVVDILEGRMAHIGRTNNWIDVYDPQIATPYLVTSCEIDHVTSHPGSNERAVSTQWRRNWRACAFDILDLYTDEDG